LNARAEAAESKLALEVQNWKGTFDRITADQKALKADLQSWRDSRDGIMAENEELQAKFAQGNEYIINLTADNVKLKLENEKLRERMKPIEEVGKKFTDDMLPSPCKICDYTKAIKKAMGE
jgi:predicted nuclease with TOPRIM domain